MLIISQYSLFFTVLLIKVIISYIGVSVIRLTVLEIAELNHILIQFI